MVLSLVTVAINARALGTAGLGVIALFQASAGMLIGVFSIGSQLPMIRLGRQAIEDGNRERVGVIAGLAILLDIGVAILAGLCALLLIRISPDLLGISREMQGLAQFYTIVIFFSGTSVANGLFRLLNRFKYIGYIQIIQGLLILAVAVTLYLGSAELPAYIIAYAVIQSATEFAKLLLTLRLLRLEDIPICFNPRRIRREAILSEYFSYGWTTSLIGTIETLRKNSDTLFLGAIFGSSLVGIYAVVKQLTGAVNKAMGTVSSAAFPEVCALAARSDYSGARKLLNRFAILGMIIGACAVVMVAMMGDSILSQGFGNAFSAGYLPLLAMMVAVAINLSSISFSGFVQAFVSPQKLLKVFVMAFGLYVISAPILIYFAGIIGASVGQIIFAATVWLACWKILNGALPRNSLHNTGAGIPAPSLLRN